MYSKSRLEAPSDGIFAIAMTLLVLEIKLPPAISYGQLGRLLAATGPDWIAFVITFFLAARYWALQHQLFNQLEQIRSRTVVTTFAFLALISAMPFSTALLGHAIRERLTLFIYFSHQAAIGAAMLIEVELGLRERNLRNIESAYKLRGRLYTTIAAMTVGAVAVWLLPLPLSGITVAVIADVGHRIRLRLDARRTRAEALPQASLRA